MNKKKDQLEEILKDQFYKEAKRIEEEVGLNDHPEELPDEVKIRMKMALDQKIREREKKNSDTSNKTDIYAGLSEEDKEALRLGREMLKNQNDEKKERKVYRKKRHVRRLVALAAVLVLVLAIGMTSFGGPERVLQFMKSSVGGRQVSQVDSSDRNKIIEEEDEEKAYQVIADEFGIEPVKLMWRPNGMKFEKMILNSDFQIAELIYWYNGEKVEFIITSSYGEVSWGYDEEDKILNHYYEKEKEATIEVTEYKVPESSLSRYVAQFSYKKVHYCMSGQMSSDELKKILENLYFM